ncbi:hypothetical protein [Pseudoxanthomonas sp. 10H]|uniref:hypothetical protein n=1 Tax=Pseudoxanthomonas sp. 10H TaxID=3242729 RepID=UPI0035591521
MSERSELWAVPRRREKRRVPAAQRPDRVPGCAFFLVTSSLHKQRRSDSLDAKRRVKALLYPKAKPRARRSAIPVKYAPLRNAGVGSRRAPDDDEKGVDATTTFPVAMASYVGGAP